MLSRDDIINANDRQLVEVHVPEWGGIIYVPRLSLAEAEAFSKKAKEEQGGGLLASRIILDANGKRVFNDTDAAALADKSATSISRIIAAFTEENSVTKKAVEQAAKNS